MRIITLTTDMGHKDYYVASIKGAIYSKIKQAVVVDISHEIKPFDIAHASYVLKNCFKDFPIGTIHIVGVNPETNGRLQTHSHPTRRTFLYRSR